MSSDSAKKKHYAMVALVVLFIFFSFCCGLSSLCQFIFSTEEIKSVEPQAVLNIEGDSPPYRHHARGRDELVYLKNGRLNIFGVSNDLRLLRSVEIESENKLKFERVVAVSETPLALLYGGVNCVEMIDTISGKKVKSLDFEFPPDCVTVSHDGRWVVANVDSVCIIDVRSGDRFILPKHPAAKPSFFGIAFVDSNSVIVPYTGVDEIQLWDLSRQIKVWSTDESGRDSPPLSIAGAGGFMISGHHSECYIRSVDNGHVLRGLKGTRSAWAVATNSKNGDFLAGYSLNNFSLRSPLSGSVRIWDSDGNRRITFAAHHDVDISDRSVEWISVSDSGDIVITANKRSVKMWKYSDLVK